MNSGCPRAVSTLLAGFSEHRHPGGIWIRDRRDNSCVRVAIGSTEGNSGAVVREHRINAHADLLVEIGAEPLSRRATEELASLMPRIRRVMDEN